MRSKSIVFRFLAGASLLLFFVAPASSGHRIQDRGKATVSLESRGRAPEHSSAIAKFSLAQRANGAHQLDVTLKVRDLPEKSRQVFEVWLVNDSGSDLNLTAFNTDNDGDATVKASRNIVNLTPYDDIVVTEKSKDSFDTSRSGRVVLSGRLH